MSNQVFIDNNRLGYCEDNEGYLRYIHAKGVYSRCLHLGVYQGTWSLGLPESMEPTLPGMYCTE